MRDQIIGRTVLCINSDRIELQTLNGFLFLLLIGWTRIHNHLREKRIFKGNNLWSDFWGSSCCYRLLATTGRQKTDQFSAPNWGANWFLGLGNSFHYLRGLYPLKPLTVGFLSESWHVMNGVVLSVTCLFICNIYDNTVQIFPYVCSPQKCELIC